jgi:hypothetical protein
MLKGVAECTENQGNAASNCDQMKLKLCPIRPSFFQQCSKIRELHFIRGAPNRNQISHSHMGQWSVFQYGVIRNSSSKLDRRKAKG